MRSPSGAAIGGLEAAQTAAGATGEGRQRPSLFRLWKPATRPLREGPRPGLSGLQARGGGGPGNGEEPDGLGCSGRGSPLCPAEGSGERLRGGHAGEAQTVPGRRWWLTFFTGNRDPLTPLRSGLPLRFLRSPPPPSPPPLDCLRSPDPPGLVGAAERNQLDAARLPSPAPGSAFPQWRTRSGSHFRYTAA